MYDSHKIKIEKTAHYYTIGTPGQHIKNFWIVCHGYGQLASRVIQKFEGLEDDETFILAPEGFSRFYWNGVYGEVAASWMTKKDRLDEIEDYANYLSILYHQFRNQLPENIRINLLGFSQGTATQCRWIMKTFPEFHNLILWAGLMPEDLDYRPYKSYFENKNILFIYGLDDQYVTQERLDWQHRFAKEQGIKYITKTFEGKHVINRAVLKSIAEDLKSTSI